MDVSKKHVRHLEHMPTCMHASHSRTTRLLLRISCAPPHLRQRGRGEAGLQAWSPHTAGPLPAAVLLIVTTLQHAAVAAAIIITAAPVHREEG